MTLVPEGILNISVDSFVLPILLGTTACLSLPWGGNNMPWNGRAPQVRPGHYGHLDHIVMCRWIMG